MTRQEIIDVFIVRAAPADRPELRRKLDRMSLDELDEAYKIIQLRAREEQLLEIQAERAANLALYPMLSGHFFSALQSMIPRALRDHG